MHRQQAISQRTIWIYYTNGITLFLKFEIHIIFTTSGKLYATTTRIFTHPDINLITEEQQAPTSTLQKNKCIIT
jgi:hypothetical protein